MEMLERLAKANAVRKASPSRRQKMARYADPFARQRRQYPKMALRPD
jgi:hypothetical protein